jgi:predicted nucleic acid-binding protein
MWSFDVQCSMFSPSLPPGTPSPSLAGCLELMQGIRLPRERAEVSSLLLTLPQFDMVGFSIAEKSAANCRLLRSKGVTVRKTIDVLIGTFCAEHGFQILHNDSDFNLMARHIGLEVLWREWKEEYLLPKCPCYRNQQFNTVAGTPR